MITSLSAGPLPQTAPIASPLPSNARTTVYPNSQAVQDTLEVSKATSTQKATTGEPEVPRHVIITAVVLACAAVVALPALAVAGVLAGIGLVVRYIHSKRHDISNYCKEVLLAS